MSMRHLLRAALALVAGVGLVVPATAVADPTVPTDRLGLGTSETGPWATSLSAPLFDPTFRWVPGDTMTSGFWAYNRSSDSTEFRITLLPHERALLDSGEFEMHVRAGDDRWEPVRSAWAAPRPLAAGEKMHIQVRASLPASASNATKTLAFGFDIRTRLTYQAPVVAPTVRPTPTPTPTPGPQDDAAGDDEPGTGAGAADGDDPTAARPAPNDGSLAGTGASQSAWVAPLGLGALITGLWLAAAGRRRGESDAA